MPIGFTLPFSKASGSLGYFEMTYDELSALKENIKSLLLTNWGERLGHYYLGCNLREFLFEQIEANELREKIADRILSQINLWMPFVSIKNLNILLASDDPSVPENAVKIKIEFILTSKPDLSGKLEVVAQ